MQSSKRCEEAQSSNRCEEARMLDGVVGGLGASVSIGVLKIPLGLDG